MRRALNSSTLVRPGIRRATGGWLLSSADYRVLGAGDEARAAAEGMVGSPSDGWRSPRVALRQHRLWRRLQSSGTRPDAANLLWAVAAALDPTVRSVDAPDAPDAPGASAGRPLLVELGCGSAYNAALVAAALSTGPMPPRYLGLDTSLPALRLGARAFPGTYLAAADSRSLPLPARGADVVLDGAALMHVPRWEAAVAEMCRVTRHAVILHSVTTTTSAPTTYLTKRAYGYPVVEVVIAEADLRAQLALGGFEVQGVRPGLAYDLYPFIGIRTMSQTWLCVPANPPDRPVGDRASS